MEKSSRTPWDRRPGESSKAFAAFRRYLELGPERSIAEAARRAGRGPGQYKRWSTEWGWVERAAQYDADDARRADASRGLDRQDALAALLEDAKRIRGAGLLTIQTTIRRDAEGGTLTADPGPAARAGVALYELYLHVLDRLGLLPARPASRTRGGGPRLRHEEQAGRGGEADERHRQLADMIVRELEAEQEEPE